MSETQSQSARGRGNPQPLRVNHSSRGSRGGHTSDADFIHPHPPGSSHSQRPGTQGGQSARSHGSRSTHHPRFTPRKEQTIVGVGTMGLGDKGKEIHSNMRTAVFAEWCKRKDEERAQANSPEAVEQRQLAVQPLSPEQRRNQRQSKIIIRKQNKEYDDEIRGEANRKERLALDEDHKRQKKDTKEFIKKYSEDNVNECRSQISRRVQHRKELESFRLPELEPLRKEIREEKERWQQQQLEEDGKWEEQKAHRREYILELKRIAAINLEAAKTDKESKVAEYRAWVREKERQRIEEARDLQEKRRIDAKEEKAKLRAEIQKAKYKNWEAKDKKVQQRKEEDVALSGPILEDREAALNAKRQGVKELYEAQRTPRGNGDNFFDGSRKDFFASRKAAADDIRAEKARNCQNVQKEKEETKVHRLQQHEEGLVASKTRIEKRRARPGSNSPTRSPREAW